MRAILGAAASALLILGVAQGPASAATTATHTASHTIALKVTPHGIKEVWIDYAVYADYETCMGVGALLVIEGDAADWTCTEIEACPGGWLLRVLVLEGSKSRVTAARHETIAGQAVRGVVIRHAAAC